jgi:hypothetical protein
MHAFSKDGAQTFSQPTPAVSDAKTAGDGELSSLTSTPDGNLLLAWATQGKVFCSVLNSGRWSEPSPLAPDLPDGARLSYPAVAATADAYWVLAYRGERNPERVSVVLFRSDDRGEHWRSDRVLATREFKDAIRFHPGDYVGLAAAKQSLYAAYVLREEGTGLRRVYVSAIGNLAGR